MCAFEPLLPESVLDFSGPSPGLPTGAVAVSFQWLGPVAPRRGAESRPGRRFRKLPGALQAAPLLPRGRSGLVGVLRPWSTRWSSQGEAGESTYPTPTLQSDRQTALDPEVNLRFATYPRAGLPYSRLARPTVRLPYSRLTLHLPCTWPSEANRASPETYPTPTLQTPSRPDAPMPADLPYTYPVVSSPLQTRGLPYSPLTLQPTRRGQLSPVLPPTLQPDA
jgi:hypothetical protein